MFDEKIREFALAELQKEYEAGNVDIVLKVLGWASENQQGWMMDEELLMRLDKFGRERMESSKIERR
jgi:hypothetical protein